MDLGHSSHEAAALFGGVPPLPPNASSEELDQLFARMILDARLTPKTNGFFLAAKSVDTVDPYGGLCVAVYWREVTKMFMLSTIAGVGVVAAEAAAQAAPPHHLLSTLQTAVRVISDDLNNVLPTFKEVAPEGVGGIHYVWWNDSIYQPIRDLLSRAGKPTEVVLPPRVEALRANMERLGRSPLGAALQLRVVEAIALDLCIAYRRIYARLAVGGVRPFQSGASLAWMDSHIKAEVEHHKEVRDSETGMANIADTPSKQAEMVSLAREYIANWAGALADFEEALLRGSTSAPAA